MKIRYILSSWLLLGLFLESQAQRDSFPETRIIHSAMIQGQRISYSATAGTIPMTNDKGIVVGKIFYTYYQRIGTGKESLRPLVFAFNGGPGAASAYLHLGYLGPRIVHLDDDGYPRQPYKIVDNTASILDVADLVFVDPLETGFSRMDTMPVNKFRSEGPAEFFSEQGDVKYLAEWISNFLNRHGRWLSPKYLVGESYGAIRVAGLSRELQAEHGVFLNGVVLVSGIPLRLELHNIFNTAFLLPYYCRIACQKKINTTGINQRDTADLFREVSEFTYHQLLPSLSRLSLLNDSSRDALATRIAAYSGIGKDIILERNLLIDTNTFFQNIPGGRKSLSEKPPEPPSWQLLYFSQIPVYAATAHYYQLLESNYQSMPVKKLVDSVSDFVIDEFMPAFFDPKIDSITKEQVAEKLRRMLGVTRGEISCPFSYYGDKTLWDCPDLIQKKLKGIIGSFDTRYFAPRVDFANASYAHAFGVIPNDYLRNELRYNTPLRYWLAGHTWSSFTEGLQSGAMLSRAVAENPFLAVMIQAGIYDQIVPMLQQQYVQWQLDPSGTARERILFRCYEGGHMFYTHRSEREKGCNDLRAFIINSFSKKTRAARNR